MKQIDFKLDGISHKKLKNYSLQNDIAMSHIVRVLIEKSPFKINVRTRKEVIIDAWKSENKNTNSIKLYFTDDILEKLEKLRIKNNASSYSEIIRQLITNTDLSKLKFKSRGEVIQETKERDLYPFLTYYLYKRHSIYTKTMKKYSKWAHPDIVGIYLPLDKWENTVIDISKELGNLPIKLYSYELKRELNFSNLREYFFQAVSNSSWAHEGYLVVAKINDKKDNNDNLMDEIKRLSNSFGIGLIQLNIDDPDLSVILFPAKQKKTIDVTTVNKMATVNPDFNEFLKRVKTDIHPKEFRKEQYDKVFSIKELKKKASKY